MVGLGGADHDMRDILDIDRPPVARSQQQQADIGHALQGLAGDDRDEMVRLVEGPNQHRPVGVFQLVDELAQRDAVEGELFRVGLDADLVRAAADDVGQSDIVDLDQLVLQFLGDLVEAVVVPARCCRRLRRQSQGQDRHVVDAAADDQRQRDAVRQIGDVVADLLVDPGQRGVLVGADVKPRGRHHRIVLRARIDVLDAVDAFDDVFERLGDQLDRVLRLVAVGGDQHVDHRHADLRLLLARQLDERDGADHQRRSEQ